MAVFYVSVNSAVGQDHATPGLIGATPVGPLLVVTGGTFTGTTPCVEIVFDPQFFTNKSQLDAVIQSCMNTIRDTAIAGLT